MNSFTGKNRSRKIVYAILAGVACIGSVALYGNFNYEETEHNFDALEAYSENVISIGESNTERHRVLNDLVTEGHRMLYESEVAVQMLDSAVVGKLKKAAKGGEKAMKNAMGALNKNVKYADKSNKGVVKPDKLKKDFADSLNFQTQLKKAFPIEYENVKNLNKNLKKHNLKLSNTIHDA